jgi:protoporphyrinogen IX oxidase
MGAYLYVKALHLIAMVTWFAGTFYLVRLFVYHTEAFEKPEPDRRILHEMFKVLERRLSFAIITPAMILTVVFGVWLMVLVHAWTQPWFHLKLVFLLGLFTYHGITSRLRRRLAQGKAVLTSVQYRALNEVATLLLLVIVFTAVIKNLPMIAKTLAWTGAISVVVGFAMFWGYRKKGMLGKKAPQYTDVIQETAKP